MAYGYFKDLPRRTASDKVLRDKTFNIAKNSKYHGYQRVFSSMVHKFFDKKPSVVLLHMLGQRPQLCKTRKINLLLKIKLCQTKD